MHDPRNNLPFESPVGAQAEPLHPREFTAGTLKEDTQQTGGGVPSSDGGTPLRRYDFAAGIPTVGAEIGDRQDVSDTAAATPEGIGTVNPAGPRTAGDALTSPATFYPLRRIADALGVSKPTARARARREGWQTRVDGNREEFIPSGDVLALIETAPAATEPAVQFSQLHNETSRARTLQRAAAVQFYRALVEGGTPRMAAVARTIRHFASEPQPFLIGARSLARWVESEAAEGLNGLVNQNQATCGRRAPEIPEALLEGARAHAIARGSATQPNFAAAKRWLARHPEATAEMRASLHEAGASKSSTPKWLRDALRVSMQGLALLRGPKAARLASPHIPCDWSGVPAGRLLTGDDMTMNGYAWCEWPNQNGYLVIRPQLIAFLDCGSLRFVGARVVMRSRGQYCKDDVWGGLGDLFDAFGFWPEILFEGGIWRSNVFVGDRSGLTDSERFGGLAQFGITLHHSRTPRSKPIEERFNQLQYLGDDVPGFVGRFEQSTRPEKLAKTLAQIERGEVHPREHLLHVSQVREHVARAMAELNLERQDGKILRGMSPDEKWINDAPALRPLPEYARWLYRSARNVSQVQACGRVKVSVRSGRYADHYYYDAPAILKARSGQRVVVYWNDNHPEADAAIMLPTAGGGQEFLGMAKFWPMNPRLDATDEQMAAQARLKKAHATFARAELVKIAPQLGRNADPRSFTPAPPEASRVGGQLAAAAERAEAVKVERATTQRAARRTLDRAAVDLSDLETPEETPVRGELQGAENPFNDL